VRALIIAAGQGSMFNGLTKDTPIIFILIGVLFNAPLYSLITITFWSFVSAGFYSLRAMKHLYELDRKGNL
jgi:hypothetical protein